MNQEDIIKLKKTIIYRCSHTGTKETDIFFNKLIVKNINIFDNKDLSDLKELLDNYTDNDIFLMLKRGNSTEKKYLSIIKKIIK
tara:strand:+ start:935 stop:1186 length:252 start_codon:yes stop_codon:yes gene_type:complete